MDKYEYKVRADEIKALIAEGEYAQAVAIADTIDWRRVKSVMMLCTISDLYKINRRYQESKEILLMAYERHPDGRLIVYSLCELSIKLEEYVQAIEYYKEFVQLAPKDTSRYILQYRLYEAQEVTIEERIAVLEEFKKKDYREKWAYELAYLYHRIGLASKCVEECDEMYLWFGEGRYVLKALELKMLHASLTEDQQLKYDLWQHGIDTSVTAAQLRAATAADDITDMTASTDTADLVGAPTTKIPAGVQMDDIQVKTVDVGMYNTVNLQRELAESMKEVLSSDDDAMLSAEAGDSNVFGGDSDTGRMQALQWSHTQSIRLSEADLADLIDEVPEEEAEASEPVMEEQVYYSEPETVEPVQQKVLYADPAGYLSGSTPTQVWDPNEVEKKLSQSIQIEDYISTQEAKQVVSLMKQDTASLQALAKVQEETVPGAKTGVLTPLNTGNNPFDKMLSQEYDGQIKLAVPDDDLIEKQITGQMSIDDVMAEWEEMKRKNEEKRKGEVRQRILEHTGSLFDDFDEGTRSGLLEQLEKAFVEAIMKEDANALAEKNALDEQIEREAKLAAERVHKQLTQEIHADEVEKALEEEQDASEAEDAKEEQDVASKEEADEDGVEELEEIAEDDDDDEAVRMIQEELEAHEEEDKKKKADLAQKKEAKKKQDKAKKAGQRELSEEEKQLFAPFLKHKKSKEQLIYALDNISMAAYTGNVIITGEEGAGTLQLAKSLIKEIQTTDSNFLGQVAKISGKMLNKKEIATVLEQLKGGAIIIEKASGLSRSTLKDLVKALNTESIGMIVIMEDTKKAISRMAEDIPELKERFNICIDIQALDDDALVAYAKEYAREQEYSMDEFAVLALHLRIENMQTIDHDVSLAEVRDIVDEAIYYADKKTPKHFMDVMLGKRYDHEDMIVLREKDFMHNS